MDWLGVAILIAFFGFSSLSRTLSAVPGPFKPINLPETIAIATFCVIVLWALYEGRIAGQVDLKWLLVAFTTLLGSLFGHSAEIKKLNERVDDLETQVALLGGKTASSAG